MAATMLVEGIEEGFDFLGGIIFNQWIGLGVADLINYVGQSQTDKTFASS